MAILHYFEYDLSGQRTAMADPTGRTAFSYDNLGRMTFRGNPGSLNLYYQYDATGNRTTLKDPDGFLAYYSYDSVNRLKEVSSQGYGLQPYGRSPYGGYVSYYEYDLANELGHERRANTTISYYGYDAAGRTSIIQHRTSAAATIKRFDYTRDEVGNITKQVGFDGTNTMYTYWNYDQANRITREAWRTSGGVNTYGFDYAYDPAGNRTSKLNSVASTTVYWEYDSADQMTRQKASTAGTPVTVYLSYDSNGNLGLEHDTDASAGRTYYDYDNRNLLTRVDFPGSTATNYFEYNAAGERTRKDDSTGGKKYTWDGIDVVAEKNLSGTTTQRLVKGFTPIQGIGAYALQEVNGSVIYPHKNQVGTTIRHTDGSQGITNYYEYDGWGVPLETTQGTAQQYRYTGKELDPDSIAFNSNNSRYHFPARFYLPFRGVFGQVDPPFRFDIPLKSHSPISPAYEYCRWNPLTSVDPTGGTPTAIGTIGYHRGSVSGTDQPRIAMAAANEAGCGTIEYFRIKKLEAIGPHSEKTDIPLDSFVPTQRDAWGNNPGVGQESGGEEWVSTGHGYSTWDDLFPKLWKPTKIIAQVAVKYSCSAEELSIELVVNVVP